MREYTDNLEKIVEFGLDKINPNETVTVNLRDLIYIHEVLAEYMRFFHQPTHYPHLKDVKRFLGSVNEPAGIKILHTAVYKKMRKMIPDKISNMYNEGDLNSPLKPWYFRAHENQL